MSALTISFPDFPPSEAVREAIETKTEKLDQIFPNISTVHVTVRSPHHHHAKGRRYQVHINLHVPGKELVVSRDHDTGEHEDCYVAIRDAFQAMKTQLKAYVDRLKNHSAGL